MTVVNVSKNIDLQYSPDERLWWFVKYPEFVGSKKGYRTKAEAMQAYREGKVTWEK